MGDPILKLILGILGNCCAMALFVSPLPTFWNIYKNKSTQNFSGLPYVCALLNCLLWLLYGLPFVTEHALLLITINVAGCMFEISYLTLFMTYAPKAPKRKVLKVLAACLAAFAVVVVVTIVGVPKKHRKREVGSLCVAVAVAMYVAPLSVMRLVVHTRSVQFLPFLLSLCVFLNSCIWASYGIVASDIFIMFPNGLGMMSGIAQLALYAIYRNAEPRAIVDEYDPKGGATPRNPMHMLTIYHSSANQTMNAKPCSPMESDVKLPAPCPTLHNAAPYDPKGGAAPRSPMHMQTIYYSSVNQITDAKLCSPMESHVKLPAPCPTSHNAAPPAP